MSVCLGVVVLAVGRAPAAVAGEITVDPSGGPSLQAVIDSLPPDNPTWTRILLKPGTYTQQLNVTRPHVAIVGLGAKPEEVVLTYHLSAVTPKGDGSGNVGTTDSSSTFIKASDFVATNVTFANSTPDNVAQAVAIKTQADRCVFDHCRFVGFQDTLYPTAGRCYFRECYITGDTDFIFGNATAVFDHCTINSSDRGYVTAANTDPAARFGFVFLDCTFTAGTGVKPGSTYFGRPWQWDRNKNACVTIIRGKLGPHIAAEGWHPWSKLNTEPGLHARYEEFGSTDGEGKAIDVSGRVAWSRQMSGEEAGEYTVGNVLAGSDHWDPESVIHVVTEGGK